MVGSRFQIYPIWFLVAALVLILNLLELEIFTMADDSGVAGGRAWVGDCGTNISSFLPPPYNGKPAGLSCSCRQVWNSFTIRNSILGVDPRYDIFHNIVLSAEYAEGWVGIGLSKNGSMVGSSALVGWVNQRGRAKIKQYYLNGTNPSDAIPDTGNLPLSNIPPAVAVQGRTIFLAFQLKVNIDEKFKTFILAFGNERPSRNHLPQHDDKTTILFDLSEETAQTNRCDYIKEDKAAESNNEQHKKAHGILATLTWGFVFPSGAILVRHLNRKDEARYFLHKVIQFGGLVLGLSTGAHALRVYGGPNAKLNLVDEHVQIGFSAFVLTLLQILAIFVQPNANSRAHRYWKWCHHWMGRLAILIGVLNILLGIYVGQSEMPLIIFYGFFLTIVSTTTIVLEILSKINSTKKTAPPLSSQVNAI